MYELLTQIYIKYDSIPDVLTDELMVERMVKLPKNRGLVVEKVVTKGLSAMMTSAGDVRIEYILLLIELWLRT